MDFLNVALLGGAAALLAPLIIHLFHRRRFQVVDWGAMHLLQSALESSSRRPQWESWWLLLIRCLIPVMLAVALARPVLTHYKQPSSARDAQLALMVIDNSLSMASTTDGGTLLERAQRELLSIAERSPTTQWSLWSSSLPAADLLQGTTHNLQRLRIALQRTPFPAGSDLNRATLPWGLRQLSKTKQSARQLILASDFQAKQWRSMSENELQATANQLTSPDVATQLFLLPVRPSIATENVSVELLDAPTEARVHQPLFFVARISHEGSRQIREVQVILQVAGRDLSSRTLRLASGASEQIEFACEFTELGWQHVSIRVDDAGDVHGDDVCYHVVQVTAPPQVLVVDDSLDQDPESKSTTATTKATGTFVGTSRYLQVALSPFANPHENLWNVQLIRSTELRTTPLSKVATVVVADLQSADRESLERLSDYVHGGGGLFCFANPTGPANNPSVHPANSTALLPLRYAAAKKSPADQPAGIDLSNRTFTTEGLAPGRLQGLDEFEFTGWQEMLPSKQDVDYRTLLRLKNGAPWLVESEFGRGLVVQCASSCGDDASNLPMRPAYVPLMLSIISRIAQHQNPLLQFKTGEVVQLSTAFVQDQSLTSIADSIAPSDQITAGLVRRLNLPHTDRSGNFVQPPTLDIPLQAGKGFFSDTRIPGIYSAELVTPDADKYQLQPAMFSVNVPAEESQLEPLSDRELRILAQRLGATLIESATDYDQAVRVRRDGRELWRWLLGIVLALLLAELFLSHDRTQRTQSG